MRLAAVLSDLATPPRTGLQEQSLLLLAGLAAAGVEVDLFAFSRAPDEVTVADLPVKLAAPPIPMRLGWTLTGLVTRLFGRGGLEKRLADYDAVYLEGAAAAGLMRRNWAARATINWIDPGSRRRLRFAKATDHWVQKCGQWLAAALAYTLEASLNTRSARWVVVSESDADYLRRVHGHSRTTAVPVMLPELPLHSAIDQAGQVTLTVYADLREKHMWEAFEAMARQVLQPACALLPALRIRVLGRLVPSPGQLEGLPPLPISFSGWSMDHIGELQRSDIVVLPDNVGTGLKNRAVQCLGLGCAVVGTPVAFEAIPVATGVEAIVAEAGSEMVEAILQLANSRSLRVQMGASASSFALARYGQKSAITQWLALLRPLETAR